MEENSISGGEKVYVEAFNLKVEENKIKLEGTGGSGGKTYRWRHLT